MTVIPSLADDPPATNPLFGDRKLKMGTFCTNLSYGCAATTIDGTLQATWPETVALAELADRMAFEALVPVGRWLGFGGETDFNGAGFECYSWAAGISGVNATASVFATSHVPTVHPVFAAKQAATIDHISGGRFTLNVVTGWYGTEFRLFGIDVPDHDRRYDMATEWVEIIRRLWTEDEPFDFEGEFYRIGGGRMAPKPLQTPRPPFMNAGGSERGRHFAAKYCDIAFIVVQNHDYDDLAAQIASYKELARREYGREIKVWTHTYLVQGETEKAARDFYRHYVHEKGDWEAITNLTSGLGLNAQTLPAEALRFLKEHFIAGWAGWPVIGTKEQIVDTYRKLHATGIDGVLTSWARYREGMEEFMRETHPLLVQAGLR